MSKVSITRSLLDDLAMSISAKSGEPVPMTLDEMKDAVDGIQTGGIDGNNVAYGTFILAIAGIAVAGISVIGTQTQPIAGTALVGLAKIGA